jgi:hypothetical protein
MDPIHSILKGAYILKLVGGAILGFENVEQSLVIKLLAWLYAFRVGYLKRRMLPLIKAFLMFPRFRLGIGRKDADEIPPLEHIQRFLIFRKVDLKLAPFPPLYRLLSLVLEHGLWERHIQERKVGRYFNSAFRLMTPFQRYDWTKPATMINFVIDPVDVEYVLTDREAFPTRGDTGMSVRLRGKT